MNKTYETYFIGALQDQIIKQELFSNIQKLQPKHLYQINGTHDFKVNDDWKELLELLDTILL